MRRFLVVKCFLACALAIAPIAQAAVSQEKARAVLMISVDGLSPRYVLEADKYGVKIPVLRKFANEGAYASSVLNVNPTVTYPNHTSLVTGVGPDQHGIRTNTVFDPEGVEKGGWNWYAAQVKAPSLFDAVKASGGVTAAVQWPVTVGHPSIDYNVPEYWRAEQPSDEYLMQALTTPSGFLQTVKDIAPFHLPRDHSDLSGYDEKLTRIAVAMIERAQPRFMAIHPVSLDGVQHAFGPLGSNPQSAVVLEKLDAMIGRIVAAMRKAHPDAVIAIVSDHGFHMPINTSVNLNAAFAAAGLIDLDKDGKLKSWKAYAWNSGGSASVVLKDANDKAVSDAVAAILAKLANDPKGGIARVFSGADAIANGGLPQASFVASCRGGYSMGSALTGEVVRPMQRTVGTHGYHNSDPEMNASFFVVGPGIKPGKNLGRIDIRQIAPTLARELDVPLPSAARPLLQLRD